MTRPTRALLLVVLLFATAIATVVAPGAAVSATANHTPNATPAGENVSASFVLTDLYTDASTAWQLHAATQLENATWTVTTAGLDHRRLATRSFSGRSFEAPVRASRNVSRIRIGVTGTAPPVGNFTYPSPERFRVASFSKTHGRNSQTVLGNWSATHYTPASRSARRTLDSARVAIRDNGSTGELEEQFDFATTAYREEEFDLATGIAADTRNDAGKADYPVGLISGLFLGGIVVAFGGAGIQSYRRSRDERWPDR